MSQSVQVPCSRVMRTYLIVAADSVDRRHGQRTLIRHLFTKLITEPTRRLTDPLAWSHCRRRHQHGNEGASRRRVRSPTKTCGIDQMPRPRFGSFVVAVRLVFGAPAMVRRPEWPVRRWSDSRSPGRSACFGFVQRASSPRPTPAQRVDRGRHPGTARRPNRGPSTRSSSGVTVPRGHTVTS